MRSNSRPSSTASASRLARIFSACSGLGDQTHRRDGHPRLVPDAGGEQNLPVTKSTTTHHFRVLRESGVIRQVHRGTAKMNGLRRDDLDGPFPGLLDALLDAAARQAARIRDLGDG
ncbi:hypothetical protein ACIQVC_31320 [Streptomyces sp. NPDC101112]|uniref:hypothetical protein n=1 Tax=Streptomyces sp. NPDC101112 TaxID=3366105 RepID=UPI00382BA4A5